MYELDKEKFGSFLAQQRKEKGLTQRELADRLFVSDKAVSKWERCLSIPDVSLLIPLAEILGVSVTELLEGEKIAESLTMDTDQIETLVKKAVAFSEESPEQLRERKRKRFCGYMGCVLFSLLEIGAVLMICGKKAAGSGAVLLVFEILSMVFGVYFWVLMKEKLPNYYDENEISAYSDGFFRMNLPGIRFHNGNWPYILKTGRIWSAVSLVLIPWLWLLAAQVKATAVLAVQMTALLLYVGGLFLPLWIVAKKYGGSVEGSKGKKKGKLFLFMLILVLCVPALALMLSGGGVLSSAVRVGYTGHDSRTEWTARYSSLSGKMSKKFYPEETKTYEIIVETESGALSIEMTDSQGKIIFSQEDMQSGTDTVTLDGVTRAAVSADSHRGGFQIRERQME